MISKRIYCVDGVRVYLGGAGCMETALATLAGCVEGDYHVFLRDRLKLALLTNTERVSAEVGGSIK